MEKITLTKLDITLLKELYLIYSPSEHEEEMSNFVQKTLSDMSVKFEVDNHRQIFSLKKGTPLLVAHMDQVSSSKLEKVWHHNDTMVGTGNLGADDKNGIFILLKLIREFRDKVSFIFSVCEENCSSTNNISQVLTPNKALIKEMLYGLVFDRRNGSDIIGAKNNYCTDDFDTVLESLGKGFGYHSTSGSFSDCNAISNELSCANISCGYYNPHSSNEITIISELENSLNFGRKIISEIKTRFDPPKKHFSSSTYHYKPTTYIGNKTNKSDILHKCLKCDEIFSEEDLVYAVIYTYVYNNVCPICGGGLALFYGTTKNVKISKRKFKFSEEMRMEYCKTCDTTISEKDVRLVINKVNICFFCRTPLIPCIVLLQEGVQK
uniref:Peptidase M28 domain-containing protein n=1 Tax=viral metagenome TaxID=1070528 RepID=A0A6M3JU52_9ZZZZ